MNNENFTNNQATPQVNPVQPTQPAQQPGFPVPPVAPPAPPKKKSILKKWWFWLIVVIALIIGISVFSGSGSSGSNGDATKNDYVDVEGIYVDTSYTDKDDASLKLVYVFLNVTATDKNLKIDSAYTDMIINETNTYSSEFYKSSCTFAPSYYYSKYIEDLYVGNSKKLVLTFEVPEGDLTAGKKITFSDTELPFDGIELSTDDIVSCDSPEAVCEKGDPAGYAEEKVKHEPADAATVEKVRNEVNGYYWEFQVAVGTMTQTHELEFSAPNKFELRTSFGSNGGTYEVKNAYIYITYSTNNHTVKIPYEFNANGELELHCSEAFSIYQ